MWWYIVGIIAELLALSFISLRYIQLSFSLLIKIVRSRSIAITIMTIILFPGTVLHELSHLFTAEIMGVHTGKLTLAPESIEENTRDIQSGSVMIASTDPFRRTLIGIAPFTNGVLVLTALSWWLTKVIESKEMILIDQRWTLIIIFYLILTITNTMFTSKEDMKGVVPVLITVFLLVVSAYIAGLRIKLPETITVTIQSILLTFVQNLGFVLIINLIGLFVFSILLLALKRQR